MKRTGIIAGIVTFNPDLNILNENIAAISKQVDEVIIVDNCSDNIKQIDDLAKSIHNNVVHNNKNFGIARALNQIMEYAFKNNYKWAITLDQDTICSDNLIEIQRKYCSSKVGIVAPYVNDRNKVNKINNHEIQTIYKRKWVISSASLTNVEAWKIIGGFDEKLFIDGVDIDFGLNLIKNGYEIIQTTEATISHTIGKISQHKIGPFVVMTQNHSHFRKYYIVRNILVLEKKYHCDGYLKCWLRIMKQLFLIVFFEKNKKDKVIAVIKGIKDGIKYSV